MKSDTFGKSTTDIVLAEHLTAHPEMAPWCCRTIAMTGQLLSDLTKANIQDKKFKRTVYNFIKCAMKKRSTTPPAHIDSKASSYTANIVNRHLLNYYREHIQSAKSKAHDAQHKAVMAEAWANIKAEREEIYCMECGSTSHTYCARD